MNIASLRERIRHLEGVQARLSPEGESRRKGDWHLGVTSIDAHLPDNVLPMRTLHDFTPDRSVNIPAVSAFVLMLLQRLPRRGPVLWCQTVESRHEFGRPYGPGLAGGDPGPERLVFVSLEKPRLMVFALEEALRLPHLAAVLGEGPPLSFTETRRLSLIAQKTGVPCLFINTQETGESSAAVTRWKVGPSAGPQNRHDERAPGAFAWSLELTRSRGGKPGSWEVFWNDDTHSFDTLSVSGHGTVHAHRLPPPHIAGRASA
ncbi:ImuA family protein [Pararhizobium sp.]|uniref:ImuA family protein n=1 Tax=Pararhizobium sp. TaxID=1977563 RepID=UPI00272583D5|nr:hypothetical protein [Pararhizobium sp.]MDO9416868.1 hypothetical protein [Pararhizobium sp.]